MKNESLIVPRRAVTQLALHTRLAAHHAALTGSEPAAVEALLASALLVASGGVDTAAVVNAMEADIVEEPAMLPAYRAAVDQAEQLLSHFDDEELLDLADLYDKVVEVLEGEVEALSR